MKNILKNSKTKDEVIIHANTTKADLEMLAEKNKEENIVNSKPKNTNKKNIQSRYDEYLD